MVPQTRAYIHSDLYLALVTGPTSDGLNLDQGSRNVSTDSFELTDVTQSRKYVRLLKFMI